MLRKRTLRTTKYSNILFYLAKPGEGDEEQQSVRNVTAGRFLTVTRNRAAA